MGNPLALPRNCHRRRRPPAAFLPLLPPPSLHSASRRAAAKAGHSVLQLDPAGHYGGAWASLRLGELADLLQEAAGCADGPTAEGGAGGAAAAGITGAAVWQRPGAELGPGGQYSCDLAPKVGCGAELRRGLAAGARHCSCARCAPVAAALPSLPRPCPPCRVQVLYGSGRLIELLLGSGSHHYLEFKLVQGRWALLGSYVCMQGSSGS